MKVANSYYTTWHISIPCKGLLGKLEFGVYGNKSPVWNLHPLVSSTINFNTLQHEKVEKTRRLVWIEQHFNLSKKKNLDGLVEDGLKVKQFNAEGTIKYGTDYGNQKWVFNFEQNLIFKSQ